MFVLSVVIWDCVIQNCVVHVVKKNNVRPNMGARDVARERQPSEIYAKSVKTRIYLIIAAQLVSVAIPRVLSLGIANRVQFGDVLKQE